MVRYSRENFWDFYIIMVKIIKVNLLTKEMKWVRNKYIKRFIIIIPILLAIICMAKVVKNDNQASMPIPLELGFSGKYSYDGKKWLEYNNTNDISALKGDVVIKGHLDSDIGEGAILNIYSNHIGISVYVNGEMIYLDSASEIKDFGIDLMPSMCGIQWKQLKCPSITTKDEIEFRFINYHKHGNKNAYKEALSSLLITPEDNTILEVHLKSYVKPFQMIGYALLIVAVMMIGATLLAVVFKSNMTKRLIKIGMATLFVGGYIIFDIMMICFTDELLVVKTYGRQLCLMLATFFIGLMVCDTIKDRYKKLSEIIMGCSAIVNMIIMGLAIVGKVLLYDTIYFWELMQCVVSMVLIVLAMLELKRDKNCKVELIIYSCVNLAIIIDMSSIRDSMYYNDICFKTSYVIMLILFLVFGAKQVIMDHHASIKNKKLKEELEQSRIEVMLSQIQPHFLHNSLTSVMDLCDSDPKAAKDAIADFADYLRGNISFAKTEKLIHFRTELEHIKKYLNLEKLRFEDELEVVYDIGSSDFMIPSLSVQPLIENAVKHGVSQKIGGGTVTIHTCETKHDYIIKIKDNGVGFKEGEYVEDGGTHVGIENTKKRLEMMVNAKLEIKSQKGEGTIASIIIPKRRD